MSFMNFQKVWFRVNVVEFYGLNYYAHWSQSENIDCSIVRTVKLARLAQINIDKIC